MTRVGVLAHPKKELGGGLDALREALARHGIADPVWRETGGDDTPQLVAELVAAGVDLLYLWGGDGTVQRCIDAIGDAAIELAILPAGTANLLAANLGIPRDLEDAVTIGLSGTRRRLDLGTVNGERFAVMAGVGFDAILIREADAGLKDRLGRLAYVAAGVRGVGREAVQTRIEVDGREWFNGEATCVLGGNMGDIIGGISAFPDARADDGRLDVGVVTADSAVDWARTLSQTIVGRPASSPFVHTTTGADVEVTLAKKLPYELDGEDRPETEKLSFSVQPSAITVCVPQTEEES